MPSASKFTLADPQNSGIVGQHLRDIHWVCQQRNAFLFIRPSTVATMRLIAAGFATKSMDIHDKSSDWGLTSGFVPVDQAFSKKLTGQPNPRLHPHGHGQAQPVHLSFSPSQFQELWSNGHFSAPTSTGTTRELIGREPCVGGGAGYRHFHASRNEKVCFLLERASGKVFWRWRDQPGMPPVPLWVWGYKGVPVTGDYDMWMVAPHITQASSGDIFSIKDAHGRSAASRFTVEFIDALNQGCNRVDKPVFNHGAEAQNFSFTQALDKRLAVFCPGRMKPFVLSRVLLPGLLHDILRHGYVATRNPKWMHGSTLGIEDMASAATAFPEDKAAQAGANAYAGLQDAAARAIQNRFRYGKDGQAPAAWRERYNELRYFRALGRMPDPQDEDLMLPTQAFPTSGAGSTVDTGGDARSLAEDTERRFGRAGFVQEGGHVAPVDQTKGAGSKGKVAGLINTWEQRGKKR